MGYPYPNVCLCAFLGPYLELQGVGLRFKFQGSSSQFRHWDP